MLKNLLFGASVVGSIPGSGRPMPWKRKWQLTSVFLPGKSMDRGVWRVQVHRVAKRVGQDLSTKQKQYQQQKRKSSKLSSSAIV